MIFAPKITTDNAIGYDFGLKFKLRQVKNNSTVGEVQLMKGTEENIFFGLFDFEDVDFEIIIDNRDHQNAIDFEVKLFGKKYSHSNFIIKNNKSGVLKTLEDNGGHFHFVSQGTEDGKVLVAMNAHRKNISYDESSVNCSRLGISVDIEKNKQEYEEEARISKQRIREMRELMNKFKLEQDKTWTNNYVNIVVRTLTGKSIPILIGLESTVGDLKVLIQDLEGIPPGQQRIIFGGLQLEDNRTIGDYKITNKSSVHLVLRLTGGGGVANELADTSEANISTSVGERGVVCFGRKTNQTFNKVPMLISSEIHRQTIHY